MKTLAELEPLGVEWGQARGLFANTTPLKQAEKTLEEYGEVLRAISALKIGPAFAEPELRRAVATELGDMIVTLIMQAHLQGTALQDCIDDESYIGWQFAGCVIDLMLIDLTKHPGSKIFSQLVGLYDAIADAAALYCGAAPEYCLELALNKIWDRQGEMIDGKFVKASE